MIIIAYNTGIYKVLCEQTERRKLPGVERRSRNERRPHREDKFKVGLKVRIKTQERLITGTQSL